MRHKEYDNRERRKAMKQKRVRKVFERRSNLTSEAEYNWIRYMTWDYRILDGKQRITSAINDWNSICNKRTFIESCLDGFQIPNVRG